MIVILSILATAATVAALFELYIVRGLGAERNAALHELHIANERLYAAWKEGNVIPAVQHVIHEPELGPEPLTAGLQSIVDEWESPEARRMQESVIRSLLAQGKTPAEVEVKINGQRVTVPE